MSKIVDEHQGQIHLASQLGEGTTFTLTLPKDGGSALLRAPVLAHNNRGCLPAEYLSLTTKINYAA